MIEIVNAGKIISSFFENYAEVGSPQIEQGETLVHLNVRDAKIFERDAYTFSVTFFDSGTLIIALAFDSNLLKPDIKAYEALNGYNCRSIFWKAAIEHGDLNLRCYVHAVESEKALIETLTLSFSDIKSDDNEESFNTLLSYVNY